MLRKLRGSESPAPVPSYLYSPLVPPYFCAYIVFEISTKVNFCFINFDASSLPAFSPNHVKDRQRGKDWPPSFWASSTASRYTLLTQEEIFPLGRLACHVQKMQLDDQPVTGTAARRVPFLTQAVLHSFSRLLLAVLQKTTTRPDSCTSANCPGVFYAF
jgi:hypothetical protein